MQKIDESTLNKCSNTNKSQKVLLLTINHVWYDSRLYYKVSDSLLKAGAEIHLITGNQTDDKKECLHSASVQDGGNESVSPTPLSHSVCLSQRKSKSPLTPPCEEEQFGEEMKKCDKFTYHIISSPKKIGILINLIRKGVKFKPDVVLCVEPLSLIAGYFLQKILKCRFVYDCHEYYTEAFGEKLCEHALGKRAVFLLSLLYERFERFFVSRADAVITVNEHLVKKHKKANPNTYLCANHLNERFFVADQNHANSIASETSPYSDLTIAPRKNDLVYIGSLAFERGLKIYLKTAKLFKEHKKDYNFLIIGSFKNKSTERSFFDYIKYHELESYIIYKPYMQTELVLREIRSSKIGVFVGDGDLCPKYHKTIHMKIYEYFSQSIPVIVNRLNMLSDFVTQSQGGWVINNDNDALYDLSIQLLENENLLTQKGAAGYQYVKNNCLWEYQESALYEAVFGKL